MPKRRRKKGLFKLGLKPETKNSLVALILFAMGALVVISFTGQGKVLSTVNALLLEKLGLGLVFVPFVFISAGLVTMRAKWSFSKPHVLLGTILMMIGFVGLFRTGSIGMSTFANVTVLLSKPGAIAAFITILLCGAVVFLQTSLHDVFAKIIAWKEARLEARLAKLDEETAESDAKESAGGFRIPHLSLFNKKPAEVLGAEPVKSGFSINKGTKFDTTDEPVGTAVDHDRVPNLAASARKEQSMQEDAVLTPNSSQLIWEYPPLSLLSNSEGGEADRGDVSVNADTIEATLESFGIGAKVKEVNYGPSVTQYALEITRGTKLSKVTALSTDLALALAAPTGQIRIEAPIAGRALVGIEVPNYSAQYVTLRKMLATPEMKQHKSKLATALGIDVAGKPAIMDIAAMPHVLIAGATGSGKSVAINTFMCSILFRASPAEVKFILVDPKRVELTGYNDIPHLLVPVIVEPKKVVSALKWATHEMENRYKKLSEVGVKNIDGYNDLAGHVAMPSIVIVIDELADIMLVAPGEVEESITRLAQMARAVGIHLVVATQRPSVDVITGLIKANIPARIAFNVSSQMDSRVILDNSGAEKLLGKGDMLFIPPDKAKPARVQGTYVSDPEIRALIEFIKSQGQKPEYAEEITTKYKAGEGGRGGGGADASGDDRDELFDQAARLVAQAGKGSSSLIQRQYSVGYNRAARILDQLYAAGMVGPQEGSKPREVNITRIMEYLQAQDTQGDGS
jgi:DNA segregation ATPase FtsK/SpoIIIE, S-DNA-T family